MIKCFLVTETNEAAMSLRRYSASSAPDICPLCPGQYSYHTTQTYIGPVSIHLDSQGCWSHTDDYQIPHEDERWPKACQCGYQYKEEDSWQYFHDRLYSDGTTKWPHRELPPGSMYYAKWMPKNMYWDNKEDDNLFVVTPAGEWCVDSRASNCTMPDEKTHRCWVRHGDVPNIHVDKNGFTCSAGAGSIAQANWHGFLHNGHLTQC